MKRIKGHTELVVYGRRSLLEALRTPDVEIAEVVVAKRLPSAVRREFDAACADRGIQIQSASIAQVHELSREPRHDQGVAARIRLRNITTPEAFCAAATGSAARDPLRVLALDGVNNPQNVGMIVRSAWSLGMDALLWPLVGTPWIGGLVVKASASAIYHCPIIRCDTLAEGLYILKGNGFSVWGLSGEAKEALPAHTPPHRSVYVLGGETSGIAPETHDLLDDSLRIPIRPGCDSLNVAVAAAIVCMHCASR